MSYSFDNKCVTIIGNFAEIRVQKLNKCTTHNRYTQSKMLFHINIWNDPSLCTKGKIECRFETGTCQKDNNPNKEQKTARGHRWSPSQRENLATGCRFQLVTRQLHISTLISALKKCSRRKNEQDFSIHIWFPQLQMMRQYHKLSKCIYIN